jgi:hypothetical protein
MSRFRYLTGRTLGRRATLVLAAALAVGVATPALAAWSVGGTGPAAGAATTMPGGNSPSVAVSGGDVAVRWSPSTLPTGVGVAGYTVQRYNTITGAAATVGAACAGIVAATTCTETNVPAGSWAYTVTPVLGGWTGAPSSASPTVTVS